MIPSTPTSSRFSNRSHERPAIGSNEKTGLNNPHPGTSIRSEKTEHFGKSGSTGRSTGCNTQLTGTEPINPGDGGLNSGSNNSGLTRPTNSQQGYSPILGRSYIRERARLRPTIRSPDSNPAYSEGGFMQLYPEIYL